MDLISVHPIFNMYNHDWPIHTWPGITQPAKFIFDEDGRRGQALDSMVCAGVVISGAHRAPLDPLAARRTCTRTRWSRTRSSCTGSRSPATPSCGGRSSTRTSTSARACEIGVDPVKRPRALPRLRRRHRRDPQGHAGDRHEGRADDPRVPAGGLRRGGRARRVPRARAARVRGRRPCTRGATGDVPHTAWDALAGDAPRAGRAARGLDRPDDGGGRRRAPTSRTATRGTRTSAGTWPSSCTASRTSRPCTRSSRCGRGRRSSSAAATGSRASASGPRWRTPTP